MSREWKPGDVAAVQVPNKTLPGRRLTEGGRSEVRVARWDGGWALLSNPDYYWADDYSFFENLRPLVVIDPEDREQVRTLRRAFRDLGGHTPGHDGVDAMQAALRSLITPPRPEEPLGLGAVVEAIYENRFVRVATCDEGWIRVDDRHPTPLCTYAEIAVVRVLSEGVVTA